MIGVDEGVKSTRDVRERLSESRTGPARGAEAKIAVSDLPLENVCSSLIFLGEDDGEPSDDE